MRDQPGIYVEVRVDGPLDELWQRTQDPAQHQRWDLRFTDIRYLPRLDEAAPQRFSYSTRIGFGLKIEGEGETVGAPRRSAWGTNLGGSRFYLVERPQVADP